MTRRTGERRSRRPRRWSPGGPISRASLAARRASPMSPAIVSRRTSPGRSPRPHRRQHAADRHGLHPGERGDRTTAQHGADGDLLRGDQRGHAHDDHVQPDRPDDPGRGRRQRRLRHDEPASDLHADRRARRRPDLSRARPRRRDRRRRRGRQPPRGGRDVDLHDRDRHEHHELPVATSPTRSRPTAGARPRRTRATASRPPATASRSPSTGRSSPRASGCTPPRTSATR